MSTRLSVRTHHALSVLILGLALLAAAPLQAGVNRWTSIGPYGGGVTALAFSANGHTVLAGTKTLGVFRSINNGRTWKPASGLSGEVVDLAASFTAPGWVYAVTSAGVFRSDDAGLHWAAASAGLPSVNGRVRAVRVATEPTDPAAVWAVVRTTELGELALYRSTNRGDRWRYAGRGLKGAVHDVAAHSTTAGVVFAATEGGLYRSTDSGGHWSPSGLRREVSRVVFDRVQPRHLYAVRLEEGIQNTVIGTVFVSDDGGASWKESSPRLSLYGSFELVADPAHAGTAWVSATQGSIFKTRDGGRHWQEILWRSDSTDLAVNPLRPGTVLAGQPRPFTAEEPAVFRTDDGGTTWSPSDTGITAQIVDKILPDPSQPGALYAQVGCCAVWKRRGAGQPFMPFFPTVFDPDGYRLDFGDLIFDPRAPSTLYGIFYRRLFEGYLSKSVDGGATWRQISDLDLGGTSSLSTDSITIDPAHPSTLYGVTTDGDRIYRSDDGGFSWKLSSVMEGDTQLLTVTGTAVYTNHHDTHHQRWLRRSTDGGATWTTLLELTTPGFPFVTALAEDPRDPQRLWAAWREPGFLPATGGIYRSTDGGAHWSHSRMAGNRPVFALALDPRNSNRLWAASTRAVFLSEDGGATWVSFSEGLPALDVTDLRLDFSNPDTLYAATDGGSVYELTRRAGE